MQASKLLAWSCKSQLVLQHLTLAAWRSVLCLQYCVHCMLRQRCTLEWLLPQYSPFLSCHAAGTSPSVVLTCLALHTKCAAWAVLYSTQHAVAMDLLQLNVTPSLYDTAAGKCAAVVAMQQFNVCII